MIKKISNWYNDLSFDIKLKIKTFNSSILGFCLVMLVYSDVKIAVCFLIVYCIIHDLSHYLDDERGYCLNELEKLKKTNE